MEFKVVSHIAKLAWSTTLTPKWDAAHAMQAGLVGLVNHQAAVVKHHCVTFMNFVPLPIEVATKILLQNCYRHTPDISCY